MHAGEDLKTIAGTNRIRSPIHRDRFIREASEKTDPTGLLEGQPAYAIPPGDTTEGINIRDNTSGARFPRNPKVPK